MTQRVLLLGPDDEDRRALQVLAAKRGHVVAAAGDLEQAKKHLASSECDVVIASADQAASVAALENAPPVIAIVATRDPVTALALLGQGVRDVICEPLDDLAIALALRDIPIVRRANGHRPNGASNGHAQPDGPAAEVPDIVGDGAAMQKLKSTIKLVSAQRTTVLILGESGTGKELVARAIHAMGPRRTKKFVAINCAAIPGPLLESELFGHMKGAFTDAVRDKPGLFEDADGGTLFLDEVGEMPLQLQSKLLRALQESEIRRVGDNASIKIDVRLIAATLRDLTDDVAEGRFREDLFYRLNVLPVAVPALRERPEDIPQLARFFAGQQAARHGKTVELSDDVLEALQRQPWAGNVRELENVIERAIVLADAPRIDVEFLTTVMNVRGQGASAVDDQELSIKKATRNLEADLIKRALGVTAGNRTNAAKLLEISHRALLYKMKEYGIS